MTQLFKDDLRVSSTAIRQTIERLDPGEGREALFVKLDRFIEAIESYAAKPAVKQPAGAIDYTNV